MENEATIAHVPVDSLEKLQDTLDFGDKLIFTELKLQALTFGVILAIPFAVKFIDYAIDTLKAIP